MIAVAFLFLGAGYLLLYSGFTGRNPTDELKAIFSTGKHTPANSLLVDENGGGSPQGNGGGNGNNRRGGGNGVVQSALSQLGVRYVWGGESPNQGFDCSGLVWWAHRENGITNVPRVAARQYSDAPVKPKRANLQPGDLVFYFHPITHVAIFIGNGEVVHASHPGDVVKRSPINMHQIAGYGRYW